MKSPRTVRELFAMPGFVANATLDGVFGDRHARIITLTRRKKRLCVPTAAIAAATVTTNARVERAITEWPTGGFTWSSSAGASTVRGAAACT
ncbi:MAG: hypothetical protein IDH49_03875 [Gammaproteobacteria bacterium]|nr:hypothetical protein [Gammaproteobacteria bacterium]